MHYAAALSEHPNAAHAVGETAGTVLEQLAGARPHLVACFVSPHHRDAFPEVGETLAEVLEPTVLVGGAAVAVAGGGTEVEDGPAVALWAAHLPDAVLTPVALELEATPDGPSIVGWPAPSGRDTPTLLLFADPFSFPADAFLARCNQDRPELRVIGGLASAANGPGGNRLLLDGTVRPRGAVGVLVDGVPVRTVVSQGCRPVGDPYVVTRAEGNVIRELGGRPALVRLQGIAADLSEAERELVRHGLHVGVVVDEHQAAFTRGDFLVRSLLGADQASGSLTVGDAVDVGQTVQFHVRDARAADDDLRALLAGPPAGGGLLFTCNGRGRRFFGAEDHDAATIQDLLGPLPLAGAFCAGELGPVGGRNFLHGFTASVALFPA